MAAEWTHELDLQLARAIHLHWGCDVWRADEQRPLAWEAIFKSAAWPESFRASHLKERWQENFRKWVPRERPKRAAVVDFAVLVDRINARDYGERRAPPGAGTLSHLAERCVATAVASPSSLPMYYHVEDAPCVLYAAPPAALTWPPCAQSQRETTCAPVAFSAEYCAPDQSMGLLKQDEGDFMDINVLLAAGNDSLEPPTAVQSAAHAHAAAFDGTHDAHRKRSLNDASDPSFTPSAASTCESNSSDGQALYSPASPASADSAPHAAQIPAAASSTQCATVTELISLIDWSGEREPRPKRVRGDGAASQMKHVEKEAARRSAMSDAIDNINKILPPTVVPTPATKVAVLSAASEYFKRVQDVACYLIEENKRLAATIRAREAAEPSAAEAGPPPFLRGDVARLLVVTFFMVFLYASSGASSVFSSSFGLGPSTAADCASRRVLEATPADSTQPPVATASAWLSWAVMWAVGASLFKCLLLFCFSIDFYVAMLLQDMPRLSPERLAEARHLLLQLQNTIKTELPDWDRVKQMHGEVMAALGKPLPTSGFGTTMFFGMQFIRLILHRIRIGIILERYLVRYMRREEATAIEGAAYLVATLLGQTPSLMKMYACMLASIAACNVIPPELNKWPLDCPPMLAHNLVIKTPLLQRLVSPALSSLFEATPLTTDYRDFDALLRAISAGRVREALLSGRSALAAADSEARGRVMAIVGMVFYATRRFDAALALHTGVFTIREPPPAVAVRFLSFCVAMELLELGHREEALTIVARICDMFALGGNAMMPPDLVVYHTAKAVLTDATDVVTLVAHTKEVCRHVSKLQVMPIFVISLSLEHLMERLLAALERTGPASEDLYVISHRSEVEQLCNQLLISMEEFAHWPRLIEPILQRVRGWRAVTRGDSAAAVYHFDRSLVAAELTEEPLVRQIEHTLQVARRLGVPLTHRLATEPERTESV